MGALDQLEPIETASSDELAALQLDAAQGTPLRLAYERVPHYKTKFDAAGVHPDDVRELADLAEISVHHQGRPAAELSVRHVRGADGRDRARARVERHDRQADRRRLHAGRHRHLGAPDGALDPRRRRALDRQDPRRLRLRPVHRRARRALRRRAAGRDRDPGRRRLHRAAGAAHRRFPARHHHGDALLHAGDRRRVRAPGAQARRLQPAHRHFRRRALDREHARRDRAAHGHRRRSTSTGCPR